MGVVVIVESPSIMFDDRDAVFVVAVTSPDVNVRADDCVSATST